MLKSIQAAQLIKWTCLWYKQVVQIMGHILVDSGQLYDMFEMKTFSENQSHLDQISWSEEMNMCNYDHLKGLVKYANTQIHAL